ncbi:MAG: hypothetical protein SPI86_04300 [Treponemataceae bacterium]|nr:hypothetical protein [Spirochaetales bacterium]MDY6030970.1 hypothetical protein [Treponemataceae bacterium]
MTEIDSSVIKDGVKFSEDVFFDDQKSMFLAKEKPAGKFHIDAIKKWGIKTLYTDGKQL